VNPARSSGSVLSGLRQVLRSARRAGPAVRWPAAVAVVAIYALLSLEPFDWQIPRKVHNHAERLPEGWRFAEPGIVTAPPPHDWLEAAREAESLEISLTVRPLAPAQSGPARIFTISRDTHLRNLTIGQDGGDLVVRLRTEDTDLNGIGADGALARLEDVFRAGAWTRIDLQIAPGALRVAIDGERALLAELPPAVLRTWHSSLGLALGNEMTCDRPWLGEIREATVKAPGQRQRDYARADGVDLPATCWVIGYPPAIVPFRVPLVEDAARNVAMYLPLGFLVGLLLPSTRVRAFAAGLLVVFGISASFELAQLFIASRFSSIDDTIANTAGGALGLGVALWLVGRRGRDP
jgi:VanZ like family